MLRIRARTGPLEGASAMCMVYSPMFRLRGFWLRTGLYSSKSFSVMMPPGTSRGGQLGPLLLLLGAERDLLPGCPPQCSEPWSLCRTRRDPPRRFSGTYRPTSGIGRHRFPSGYFSESRRTQSWQEKGNATDLTPSTRTRSTSHHYGRKPSLKVTLRAAVALLTTGFRLSGWTLWTERWREPKLFLSGRRSEPKRC